MESNPKADAASRPTEPFLYTWARAAARKVAQDEAHHQAALAASAALVGVSEGDEDTLEDAVNRVGRDCWSGLVSYIASLRTELEEIQEFGRAEELRASAYMDEQERVIASLRTELAEAKSSLVQAQQERDAEKVRAEAWKKAAEYDADCPYLSFVELCDRQLEQDELYAAARQLDKENA